MSRSLGSLTWPDLAARRPVVVVPIGSCEQHGPHLPLDTDTVIAIALADGLAAERAGVLVAPPLAIGASWEHAEFPGLLSITNELLSSLLVELAHSAVWSSGLVFVNGHGGNATGVTSAVSVLRAEGRAVLPWWPLVVGGDAHAGRTETALLLAIDPGRVRVERAEAGHSGPASEAFTAGLRTASPNGVLGAPRGATVEEGEALLARLIADLVGAFDAWHTGLRR